MPDKQDDDDKDPNFDFTEPTPSRTRTVEDNPALSCTVEQLAFAAWQRAVGAASLTESGPAWEAFSAWWGKHATEYTSIRDVCAMAWAESSARALEEWWHGVVASSQPSTRRP
jgi:hypothetical protein